MYEVTKDQVIGIEHLPYDRIHHVTSRWRPDDSLFETLTVSAFHLHVLCASCTSSRGLRLPILFVLLQLRPRRGCQIRD